MKNNELGSIKKSISPVFITIFIFLIISCCCCKQFAHRDEIADTPVNELTDKNICESVTIYGITITVNSVIDSQTSTGLDAYDVDVTYKNNSGKSLTISPYDWHTVLSTGIEKAHVGGGSFNNKHISDGEEWTGVVKLWKDDDTEKIKFESTNLNFLKDDKKFATWVINLKDKSVATEKSTTTTVSAKVTTEITTVSTTVAPTDPPIPETTEAPYTPPVQSNQHDYVLNTSTMKFHYPNCSSVEKISAENRSDTRASRDDVLSWGYDPCGKCHP